MTKKECFGRYNGRSEDCVRCNDFECICERNRIDNTSPIELLKERIAASAIKVSTVKLPHTYMKAVGTKELEKIIEEVFSDV